MVFQEWWQSLSSEKQILSISILSVVLKGIDELKKDNHLEIAKWILNPQTTLGGAEREAFLDEFIKRCDPLLDYLNELLHQQNIVINLEIASHIEKYGRTNIEVKATILGLVIKQSSSLVNLADLAKKVMEGKTSDHEADLNKLASQTQRLETLIKLYENPEEVEESALFEWEINLEGCPNLECQHINPLNAEICQKCGISLMNECPNCYNALPIVSSYCRFCGKQNLEDWSLFCRFTATAKLALQKHLYNKAHILLEQIAEEFRSHPEVIALKAEIKKGCDAEVSEKRMEIQQEISQKVETLRGKWITKIREIIAENPPDFVLAAKAFQIVPSFLQNDAIAILKDELGKKQEEAVELGRKRKKEMILQKVDSLQEHGDYESALTEINKASGLLEDKNINARKLELQIQIVRKKKKKILQEGPEWAHPGDLQKETALQEHIYVAQEIELKPAVKLRFILIPAGTFQMGSSEGYENERPAHHVTISKPFYIAITPVTQEQWEALCMENRSHFRGATLPVENASWEDCCLFLMTMAKKFSEIFRLPTEAEWEYACKAGSEETYGFGSNPALLEDYAWFNKNANQQPHEVATKKPNKWGVYDMHGNVWEWCQDCFVHDYYTKSVVKDPMGPVGNRHANRVCRGGSWNNVASDLRCSMRQGNSPGLRDYTIGFRPVLVVSKSHKQTI